ncbi:MAG: dTMP kinase [Hyphomicrobiaceae bacterium]|nr:MAG: dTMP kinase [Hyphomicrobiaceae bacterium]
MDSLTKDRPNAPGFWVVLEGPDGAGKTTQARLVEERLAGMGFQTLLVREPGGTEAGERIRSILKDRGAPLEPMAEALLFFAARVQLLHARIIPALRAGKVVVCDRWVDSTLVYQGIAGATPTQKPLQLCMLLEEKLLEGWKPDARLYLDAPLQILLERLSASGGGKDRFESRGESFFVKVVEGYRTLSKSPDCFRVDAEARVGDVTNKILRLLTARLSRLKLRDAAGSVIALIN